MSGIIGKEVSTKEEAEAAISEWNDNQEDDDKMIYLNEYEVVPDEHL